MKVTTRSKLITCENYKFELIFFSALPVTRLQEYREKFIDQYHRLNTFYRQISKLKYFSNIIQLPALPKVK